MFKFWSDQQTLTKNRLNGNYFEIRKGNVVKNVLDFELRIGIDLRENSNKSITKTLS